MTLMHINTKNKFFFSLISILIIFISISTLGNSLLYLNNIEKKIEEIHNEYNENLLYQSKSSVEKFYESLLDIDNQIYSNNSILTLINNNDSLTSREKIYLLDWLEQLKNNSDSIHSVSLYLGRTGNIYDTEYGYCHYLDFPDRDWITYNSNKSYKKVMLVDKREHINSLFNQTPNTPVFSVIFTLPSTSIYADKIIINVDIDKLHKEVLSRLEDSSRYEFAIINQDNEIILGDENPMLTDLLTQNELVFSNEKQQLLTTYKDQLFQLNALPSSIFSWNFIWVNSRDNIDSVFTNLRNILFTGSLTLLILSISIAVYVSKKATKPMDDLLGKINYDDKGLRFIEGFRDNIQTALNDNILMNEKLAKTSPIYKERLLYSMLTNPKADIEGISTRLVDFKIDFKHTYFYVISIEIVNIYQLKKQNININTVKNEIGNILRSTFWNKDMECQIINIDFNNLAIIINTYMDSYSDEKELLSTISKKTLTIYEHGPKIETAFGISKKSSDLSHLHALYLQSTQSLHHRNLNAENSLIYIDEIDSSSHDICLYDIDDIFESNLLKGNETACVKQINDKLDKLSTSSQVSKTEFEQFILHVLSIILRVSLKTRINIANNTYLNGDIWNLTLSIKTVYAAKEVLTDVISYVCIEITALESNNEHIHLNTILNYIDQHYTENLSMDMVSEAVNLSSSYIYKILKEDNKTFTEHLTERRLKSACDLLKSDTKIKDIAEQVGFSNSKYFIHVFKKYKGMTPTQYKKVLL